MIVEDLSIHPSDRKLIAPARLEYLAHNVHALHDLACKDLTPLTVLPGPNDRGKSTLVDVLAFLSECFLEWGAARPGSARAGRENQDQGQRSHSFSVLCRALM